MSTFNYQIIADRLTRVRLTSYLEVVNDDIHAAIRLYNWNARVAASFHEDLGCLEVVFRNAVDESLVTHGAAQVWQDVWYRRCRLFVGKQGDRALKQIEAVRKRATSRYPHLEIHGKVIAELNFGFWRFMCTEPYLTSLWVPAVVAAFPQHPSAGESPPSSS